MGAGALVGAGKGNTQIWGGIFHFGLANLYLVVYTERDQRYRCLGRMGPGGGWGTESGAFGDVLPVSAGFFHPEGHVFSRESGKERG